jgi:uncharacterized membrane protein
MNRARLVPVAGILMVVAIIVAFVIGGDTPDGDASLRKIVTFYRENDTEQIWAVICLAWGTAFFMMFAAGLWRIVRLAETERYGGSALLLAGSALWTAGATIFAGISFTLGDFAKDLGPSALQTLNALNSDMFLTLAVGTFAFSAGAGISVLNTRVLPKWMGWVAIVIAVLALTPLGFGAILAMGIWVLVASVILLLRGEPSPAPAAP